MSKTNPFNPNSPVHHGMFVGRTQEIFRLETGLLQTSSGRPTNFLVSGERGIGKTSLINFIIYVAKGEWEISKNKHNFLIIDTDITKTTSQLTLVRRIQLGLSHQLAETEKARTLFKKTWDFLQRVDLAGFSIDAPGESPDMDVLLDEFAYSLSDTVKRLCEQDEDSGTFTAHYDGLVLMVDEADNASPDLDIGAFFKLLLERLQRRGCSKLMVCIVGLPQLRNVLRKSHPSSLRMFEDIELRRLSTEEVNMVIDGCIEQSNEENEETTLINAAGRNLLVSLSEGYPHFIQQFGFSAFNSDEDNIIDRDDVAQGAFADGGALELIGERYYRDDFYNKIQKDSYRQVLRIMADNLDDWVTKKEIREKFKGTENTLSNAIKALRDRNIILSKEGSRGVYRLQHKGFALWIRFNTIDPQSLQHQIEILSQDNSDIDHND